MTDTDALTERIARALTLPPHVRGQLSKIGPVMKRREAERIAQTAAVLPIVADEVRAASERAFDEGLSSVMDPLSLARDPSPYRETGDEHE